MIKDKPILFCTVCKIVPVKLDKDGTSLGRCLKCLRDKSYNYYHNNREKIRLRRNLIQKNRSKDRRSIINQEKLKPCADCGGVFPPYAMDFHHLDPNNKTDTVSKLVKTASDIRTVLKETTKCIVLCANCHRIRTHTK